MHLDVYSCKLLHKNGGTLRCATRWDFYISIIISCNNDAFTVTITMKNNTVIIILIVIYQTQNEKAENKLNKLFSKTHKSLTISLQTLGSPRLAKRS